MDDKQAKAWANIKGIITYWAEQHQCDDGGDEHNKCSHIEETLADEMAIEEFLVGTKVVVLDENGDPQEADII